ncbi:MAG: asparagine synthase (glutamine-hydrolyzing) [Deltaproteobacteria bacterium]|nr:asparagine synthase (glutamine-hydrolyzing) [Deltaproteobacteria bacterium]
MCGIAGFSGSFAPELLDRMSGRMAHRGPDDSGAFHDPKKAVGLVHRRLAIIDLSPLGHQPMWDSEHRCVIVFNGEIFNYLELRRELEAEGYPFRSRSDTEVLLALYRRDGAAMLASLNGMFAFALYDTQSETLFLARDGIGIKPLYVAQTEKGFLFASEMKSILEEPTVDRELDPRAVLHYLTLLWCPSPRTPLKSIRKVKPGEALLVHHGKIERAWEFYDLPYHLPVGAMPPHEAVEAVRTTVARAVERQMVSDVPVGAFLSGGLDSSTVVAMACGLSNNGRMQCFTIGMASDAARVEGMAEDLPYARRVAQELDIDLHTIQVGAEMIEELGTMIYHLDEPQGDPAPLNALFISRLARTQGITVLLSGAGGDDIFTGYRRHRALLDRRYWDWLPAGIRQRVARAAREIPTTYPSARRLRKALQHAPLDGDAAVASYFLWLNEGLAHGLLSPELHMEVSPDTCLSPLLGALQRLPEDTHPLNRMLYLEGKFFLTDHNLNYTDKMSMSVGVEVRVPLLDPEVVKLAATLPIDYKQRGPVGKWIFKKAAEPFLPREVIYRPKTGFGAPLRQWLRRELRPAVDELLAPQSLESRGIFDSKTVWELIDRDRKGRVDGAYAIFALICVELWCRTFIDGPRPEKIDMSGLLTKPGPIASSEH